MKNSYQLVWIFLIEFYLFFFLNGKKIFDRFTDFMDLILKIRKFAQLEWNSITWPTMLLDIPEKRNGRVTIIYD